MSWFHKVIKLRYGEELVDYQTTFEYILITDKICNFLLSPSAVLGFFVRSYVRSSCLCHYSILKPFITIYLLK